MKNKRYDGKFLNKENNEVKFKLKMNTERIAQFGLTLILIRESNFKMICNQKN